MIFAVSASAAFPRFAAAGRWNEGRRCCLRLSRFASRCHSHLQGGVWEPLVCGYPRADAPAHAIRACLMLRGSTAARPRDERGGKAASATAQEASSGNHLAGRGCDHKSRRTTAADTDGGCRRGARSNCRRAERSGTSGCGGLARRPGFLGRRPGYGVSPLPSRLPRCDGVASFAAIMFR